MTTLEELRERAHRMDLEVDTDWFPGDDDEPTMGYWILSPETGEGPWPDENFSTSLEEVERKIYALEAERGIK